MSLLEGVVGMAIFLMIVSAVVRLHTEANLPRQGMVRDFSIAMNLCERIVNSLQQDIGAGDPPPSTPENLPGLDITEAVLEKFGDRHFLDVFAGGIGSRTSELTVNFRVFLRVTDVGKDIGSDLAGGSERYYKVRVWCQWGRKPQHTYSLDSMVYRR